MSSFNQYLTSIIGLFGTILLGLAYLVLKGSNSGSNDFVGIMYIMIYLSLMLIAAIMLWVNVKQQYFDWYAVTIQLNTVINLVLFIIITVQIFNKMKLFGQMAFLGIAILHLFPIILFRSSNPQSSS